MCAPTRPYAETHVEERFATRSHLALKLASSKIGKVIIRCPKSWTKYPKPRGRLRPSPRRGLRPRRSPVKFIVLGMLVVGVAVGAWAWFHFRDRVSSDDAQVDAHIVAVAPKISGQRARSPGQRQPGGEGRRCPGAHRPARLPGASRYRPRRLAAGAEPAAYRADRRALDQRNHRSPAPPAPPRNLPTPWPNSNVPALRYEQAAQLRYRRGRSQRAHPPGQQ